MISSTVAAKPLRSSLRPRFACPSPLPPQRRQSTVAAASSPDPRPPALHAFPLDSLRRDIGRESKLHRLRDAFLPPGVPHLAPTQQTPAGNPLPRIYSKLPDDYRNGIEAQLERCNYRADYLILVSAVLAQRNVDKAFNKHDAVRLICARLFHLLIDSPPSHADPNMLILAHAIRFKLEDAHIQLPDVLLGLGLLCAASCHSFSALRLYLHKFRALDYPIPPRLFGRVVDSLVNPAHPAVRTHTPWLRPWSDDHALAVMLGFTDAPPTPAYDLSHFLPRNQWHCMSRWLRALARLKAHDQLRTEWAMWLQDPRRNTPKECTCLGEADGPSAAMLNRERKPMWRLRDAGLWNTATRGDLALLEAFRKSGCVEEAWSVLAASDVPFEVLSRETRSALSARPEFAPPRLWTDEMRAALLQRYADDLAEIEAVFEVEWVWDEESGTGHHRLASGGSWFAEMEDFTEDLVLGSPEDDCHDASPSALQIRRVKSNRGRDHRPGRPQSGDGKGSALLS
ncbi:atp-dependent dna helicase [Diplodia corticola]|uniref:Atp-dependent dna helicase n=1 Tax=Diplodia corticola TaxID=236234 RepID=A0A1J9RI92_9PEZI|nr:atp-dependent dna helicase [Diplodia corticola]OJD32275.1 atp-dependent dna helicase [Diplodia corticola]